MVTLGKESSVVVRVRVRVRVRVVREGNEVRLEPAFDLVSKPAPKLEAVEPPSPPPGSGPNDTRGMSCGRRRRWLAWGRRRGDGEGMAVGVVDSFLIF